MTVDNPWRISHQNVRKLLIAGQPDRADKISKYEGPNAIPMIEIESLQLGIGCSQFFSVSIGDPFDALQGTGYNLWCRLM